MRVSGDDYVAINVRNKRVPPPRRSAPRIVSGMPGALRGVKIVYRVAQMVLRSKQCTLFFK